ncbi:hypothetical protein ABTX81_19320 [Kitasatospora sp. NPDC097605]|uniref:hypothetical protein n=1 Tax=Kitasatospora sp. NPDC097605 TaxID=3157226 RepID=UPI00332FCACB
MAEPVLVVDFGTSSSAAAQDILTADADQLASMEEQLRGIAGQGDFGPHLPPDLPPDLRGPA